VKLELQQNLKNFRKQEEEGLAQNQKLQAELEELKRKLKEKEQMYRISQFRLNELKRTTKHGQLKPIQEVKK